MTSFAMSQFFEAIIAIRIALIYPYSRKWIWLNGSHNQPHKAEK